MKTQWTTILIATTLVVAACAAWGQEGQASPGPYGKEVKIWGSLESKPKTNESYQPEKVNIGIGSFDMFELKNGAAGYSLAEREVAIYNRLTEIVSKTGGRPESVWVGQVRSAPTVYVGPYRLVSVYTQDATAAGMTQEALAQKWCAKIAAVLPKVVTENVAPKPKPGAYEVAVGGLSILRLRDCDGYATIKARGRAVEDQIVLMLSDGRKANLTARAVPDGVNCQVKYGDLLIVAATPADAALNGITTELQAAKWSAALNAALAKLKSSTGDTPTIQ
ncbi:MAG: hypothetical protein WCP21_08140 [Armatimonadota bacterium]